MTKADTDSTTHPRVSAATDSIAESEFFRRSLFGAAAVAAITAALPPVAATAAPHPDADLIAACEAFFDADQGVKDAEGRDDDFPASVMERWYDALDRVTALRATTLAGIKAKARVAHASMTSVMTDLQSEESAGLAVLADILAGAVA